MKKKIYQIIIHSGGKVYEGKPTDPITEAEAQEVATGMARGENVRLNLKNGGYLALPKETYLHSTLFLMPVTT